MRGRTAALCAALPTRTHASLQFINKGKRAKAWKELEALLKTKPSSALCITAAKMHMIAAVEQVGWPTNDRSC